MLKDPPHPPPNGTAPAVRLVFSQQPAPGVAGDVLPEVDVSVEDYSGTPVTTFDTAVTISLGTNPSGATLSGTPTITPTNGVAKFLDLRINRSASGYRLTATSTDLPAVSSSGFTVTPGAPTKLDFSVQPSNVMVNNVITPPVQLTAYDSLGNQASNYSGVISVALGHDGSITRNARLSGSKAAAAASGVASFADLSIDQIGQGYTITGAFGTAAPVATSGSFDVTALPTSGSASRLAFTQQPQNTSAGSPIVPAVQVAAKDSAGNTVSSFSSPITITLGANPGNATLSGTPTVSPVNGVATFSNLVLDRPQSGYKLTASAAGLPSATSATFLVTPGPATQLTFTVQPSNAMIDSVIRPPIKVTAYDALGNLASNFTGVVAVAIDKDGSTLHNARLSGGRATSGRAAAPQSRTTSRRTCRPRSRRCSASPAGDRCGSSAIRSGRFRLYPLGGIQRLRAKHREPAVRHHRAPRHHGEPDGERRDDRLEPRSRRLRRDGRRRPGQGDRDQRQRVLQRPRPRQPPGPAERDRRELYSERLQPAFGDDHGGGERADDLLGNLRGADQPTPGCGVHLELQRPELLVQ